MSVTTNDKLKHLAYRLRETGITQGDHLLFLFNPEEAKEYADFLDPPPRFNEAQMAVFNALHLNGVKEIKISYFGEAYSFALLDKDGSRVSFKQIFGTEEDIDLAELLGNDGAHEKT